MAASDVRFVVYTFVRSVISQLLINLCVDVSDPSTTSLKFLYDSNLILDCPHLVLQIFQLNQYSEHLISTWVYKGHLI